MGATALALGALGVVYGDIGTSPLYSFKEAFTEKSHRLAVDEINVYGVCSLAFWSLVIIISIKYLMLVMRADNEGEGGILALTALVMPKRGRTVAKAGILVSLGVFGTSLLYGDGIITPAISVLSAVEGLEEVSTSFEHWVIPIAIVILIGLFGVQRRGTGAVGKVFGPVMMIWFATIAVLGLWHISDSPGIIKSVNPYYAIHFFSHESAKAFLSLGSIFLVVTGGEALYADMGHFGRRPIVLGWYGMVLPSLLLNYWGQGAFLIGHPDDVHSVFFRMVPESLLPWRGGVWVHREVSHRREAWCVPASAHQRRSRRWLLMSLPCPILPRACRHRPIVDVATRHPAAALQELIEAELTATIGAARASADRAACRCATGTARSSVDPGR